MNGPSKDAGVERIARLEKLAAAQDANALDFDAARQRTPDMHTQIYETSAEWCRQTAADIRAVLSLLPHPPVDPAAEEVAGRLEVRIREGQDYVILHVVAARGAIDTIRSQSARIAELEGAISWALGEGDSDFGDNEPVGGKPRFWWRAELRRRAAPSSTSSDTTGGA